MIIYWNEELPLESDLYYYFKSMENKLKELLNTLIKKGWKPRWYEDVYEFKLYKLWYTIARPQKQKMISFATETRHYINWNDYIWYKWYSLRELVSRESWLWQFCIANHLLKKYSDLWDDNEYVIWRRQNWMDWKTTDWEYIDEDYDSDTYHQDESYQRWLIESSLKDESELEDFLLNSIKLD